MIVGILSAMDGRLLFGRTVLAVCLFCAGCGGPDLDYKQARHLDATGQFFRALKEYENFLKKHPQDHRSVEVRYRAGLIYARKLDRCREAVPLFEDAARDRETANKEWVKLARLGLLSCPDYFPLRDGTKWLYVDSLSLGKNMRLDVGIRKSSGGVSGLVSGKMFAGEQMIQWYKRSYDKQGWAVYETIGEVKAPILKYPFQKGRKWDVRRGKILETFEIVEAGAQVEVKAGKFEDCLKVRRQTSGYPSWVYDYYCAGIGRVKTSIGVPGRENPNTELAKVTFSAASKD